MPSRRTAAVVTFAAIAPLVLLAPQRASASLDPGDVFISNEVAAPNTLSSCSGAALLPAIRDSVDALDSSWEVAADASGLTDAYYLQLPIEDPTSSSPATYSFYDDLVGGSQLVPGGVPFTAAVSPRDVPFTDVPDYGGSTGVASVGTLMTDGSGNPPQNTTVNTTKAMQDCAPYPTSYWDSDVLTSGAQTLPFWNNVDNSGISANTLDGVLFDFSSPIRAFGAWFGDLESRTAARPQDDEAPLAPLATSPTPAYLKLFDVDGNLIYESVITPTTSPQDDTTCGGPVIDTDLVGCGNQSTRWIGFVVPEGQPPVARMLVSVGDDDSCVQVQDSQCDGSTEHLSWIGARVRLAPSRLTINKTEVDFDGSTSPGAGWNFDVSYTPTGASTPITTLGSRQTGTDGIATVDLTAETPVDLTIAETAQQGWELDSLVCTVPDGPDTDTAPDELAATRTADSVTFVGVAAHVNVTCSATNKRVLTTLNIVKQELAGGAVTPGDGWEFSVSASAGPAASGTTASGSASIPFQLTATGDVTVDETAVPGWTLGSVACSDPNGALGITLDGSQFVISGVVPGSTVSCVVTNVAPTSLTITKTEVTPAGESLGAGWEFTATIDGQNPQVLTTADNGQAIATFEGTAPVTIGITETKQSGWAFGTMTCVGLDGAGQALPLSVSPTAMGVSIDSVPPGTALSCAVKNLKSAISLVKDGPTAELSPGDSADFPIDVTNEGSSTTTDIVVVDNLPAGLTYTGFNGTDWTCDGTATIVTCSYANDLLVGESTPTLTISAVVDAGVESGISMRNVAFVTSSSGTDTDDHIVITPTTTTTTTSTTSTTVTTAPTTVTTAPTTVTTAPTTVTTAPTTVTTAPTTVTTAPTTVTTFPATTGNLQPTTTSSTVIASTSSSSIGSSTSSSSTSMSTPASVLAAAQSSAAAPARTLSSTGATVGATTLAAMVMVGIGLLLTRGGRRRRNRDNNA